MRTKLNLIRRHGDLQSLYMLDTFNCTLVTPQKQILDEQVVYASIPARDGLIGAAPNRAALLVALGNGPLRLDDQQGNSRWFFVGGGFAQMKENRLMLLTDEAVAAGDLDRQQVEEGFQSARTNQAVGDDAVDRRDRELGRARAMNRLLDHDSV